MKKTLITLLMVLLCAMLIISCSNEPKDEGSSTTPSGTPSTSSYTVTFNLNGGTGTFAPVSVEPGKTIDAPTNKPTMTNGGFKFWSKNGTDEFKFDTAITETTTLYAVWETTFAVGDTGPAGGYIFYDCDADNNDGQNDGAGTDGLKSSVCGWRYLEAAPSDLTSADGATATFVFGYYYASGYKQVLSSGNTAIGTGKKNTKTLVDAMVTIARTADYGETTTDQYATTLCNTYRGGGFSDWFLPSQEELKLMYDKKSDIGGFTDTRYWSSSESGVNYAVYYDFSSSTNAKGDNTRANAYRVRPIRAFAEAGSSSESSTQTTTYTVTFNFDNSEIGNITRTVVSGEKVIRPADPVNRGYFLAAWNKTDGTKFDFSSDTVMGDITLTAQWKQSYTLGQTVTYGSTTWKVLSVDTANSRMLVISEKVLGTSRFGTGGDYANSDIKSTLRSYITTYGLSDVSICTVSFNNDGTTTVGSGSDKLFLLSQREASDTYLKEDSARVANSTSGSPTGWWLRSSAGITNVYYVNSSGSIETSDCNYSSFGIRPAMWVNLQKFFELEGLAFRWALSIVNTFLRSPSGGLFHFQGVKI